MKYTFSLCFAFFLTSVLLSQTSTNKRFLIASESNGGISKWHIKDPTTGQKPYFYALGFTPKIAVRVRKNLYIGVLAHRMVIWSNYLDIDPLYGVGIFGRLNIDLKSKDKVLSRMRIYTEAGLGYNNYHNDPTTIRRSDLYQPVANATLGLIYDVYRNFHLNMGFRQEYVFGKYDFSSPMFGIEYYF